MWKRSNLVATTKENKSSLTIVEIVFNRLSAVLLIIFIIPLFLNIITIPTIIIFIVFSIFLWLGKKYHPFANAIFLIFALGIYFIPIMPIAWGTFGMLKELRFGYSDFNFASIFFITPLIFVSLSVRNVLCNIFVYFNANIFWRSIFYFISLLIIVAILLAYPLYS
jgi:hypothetical protein